jgi:hypothetical protein
MASTQFKATARTIQRIPLERLAGGNRPHRGVFMRTVQIDDVAAPQTFHRIGKTLMHVDFSWRGTLL